MKNFDAFFQEIYAQPLEKRGDWYAETTEAYARYRAPYVPQIIQIIHQYITPATDILEIGSGPGNATQHFVDKGHFLICLEPNPQACTFAKERFQNYPHIAIFNTTFEAWYALPNSFDIVLATTSFHWLQPDTRCPAIAKLLKPNGKLILLWNTVPQPDPEIFQYLLPVYQKYMPSFASFENIDVQEKNLENISQTIIESGYFKNLELFQIIEELDYSPEDYLCLLTTLSPYIALAPDIRTALLGELRTIFQRKRIQKIPTQYICAAHIADVKLEVTP